MRDYEIRELLKRTELAHFVDDADSKVIDELDLATTGARVDVAVINGSLHAYEIKGASDTLNRLYYQIEAYTKVFEYVSIVTEEKHSQKIQESTPDWIGIYVCRSSKLKKDIVQIRQPKLNTERVGFNIAKLLWKPEILELLASNTIPHKKTDRTWLLCELLANNLDVDTLSAQVRAKLKVRNNWKES